MATGQRALCHLGIFDKLSTSPLSSFEIGQELGIAIFSDSKDTVRHMFPDEGLSGFDVGLLIELVLFHTPPGRYSNTRPSPEASSAKSFTSTKGY